MVGLRTLKHEHLIWFNFRCMLKVSSLRAERDDGISRLNAMLFMALLRMDDAAIVVRHPDGTEVGCFRGRGLGCLQGSDGF